MFWEGSTFMNLLTGQYWVEQLNLRPDDLRIKEIVEENYQAIAYAPEFIKNRTFYQSELNKWHCLFTISSLDECCMCWSDSGELFFYIHEDDLKARNFERVYASIVSG